MNPGVSRCRYWRLASIAYPPMTSMTTSAVVVSTLAERLMTMTAISQMREPPRGSFLGPRM